MRQIAILRANALGDFIFALPAIAAVRRAYPDARILLLAKAWHREFLAGRAIGIDEVVPVPAVRGVGAEADEGEPGIVAFAQRMRERRLDLVLQMHGGGRHSNRFVRRLGARMTAGLRTPDAEPLDRWIPYHILQNERLRLLEVASLVGARPIGLDAPLPLIGRDFEELDRATRGLLPRAAESRPLVVLQPGASDVRRRWPVEHFAAVGDHLAARGALVALNGVEGERDATAAVMRAMRHPAVDLTGRLSISALAALLGRARLLVSNDTGPLHVAHALGTPAVGIYWLTNLVISAPLAWGGLRYAISPQVHCPVCGHDNFGSRCPHQVSFVDEVPLEEVVGLADEAY